MSTITLSAFIAKIGDAVAAELFDVSRHTAKAWRLGRRTPSLAQAQKIMERTPLTIEGILNSKTEPRPKGSARPPTRKDDRRLKRVAS